MYISWNMAITMARICMQYNMQKYAFKFVYDKHKNIVTVKIFIYWNTSVIAVCLYWYVCLNIII